jgi:hypothetical protein
MSQESKSSMVEAIKKLQTTSLETIPAKEFTHWVRLVKTKLADPQTLQLFLSTDVAAVAAWVKNTYLAEVALKDTSPEHREASLTEENCWKLLRNALNSILIEMVTHDFLDQVKQPEATLSENARWAVSFPDGTSLQFLDPKSDHAQTLRRMAPRRLFTSNFELKPNDFPNLDAYLQYVLETACHQVQDSQVPVELSAHMEVEGQRMALPFDRSQFAAVTEVVIRQAKSYGETYSIAEIVQPYESEFGRIYVDPSIKPIVSALPNVACRLSEYCFERYFAAWIATKRDSDPHLSTILAGLAQSIDKGHAEKERLATQQLVASFTGQNSREQAALYRIRQGFSAGVSQITRLYELQAVANSIAQTVERQQITMLSEEIVNELYESYSSYEHQLDVIGRDELTKGAHAFIQAVHTGDHTQLAQLKALQASLKIRNEDIPIKQIFDDILYTHVLGKGTDEHITVKERPSLRIPLLLARLHVAIFDPLVTKIETRASGRFISPEVIANLLNADQRPSTLTTGCPAIPEGSIQAVAATYNHILSQVLQHSAAQN